MSSSFADALWSAANLVQGPLCAYKPCMATKQHNRVPGHCSTRTILRSLKERRQIVLQTILFVPRNTIEDQSQRPALKTTAPSTSSCKYGLDVHSTFRLPGQSIGSVSDGSLPGGSSRGSSFPPRIIAPIPRRATRAIVPYDTPLRPAMPVSCIDPLNTMLSTWQHTSGTNQPDQCTGETMGSCRRSRP